MVLMDEENEDSGKMSSLKGSEKNDRLFQILKELRGFPERLRHRLSLAARILIAYNQLLHIVVLATCDFLINVSPLNTRILLQNNNSS